MRQAAPDNREKWFMIAEILQLELRFVFLGGNSLLSQMASIRRPPRDPDLIPASQRALQCFVSLKRVRRPLPSGSAFPRSVVSKSPAADPSSFLVKV